MIYFLFFLPFTWMYWSQTESAFRPVPYFLVGREPVKCSSTSSWPCCSKMTKCRCTYSPVRTGNPLCAKLCHKLWHKKHPAHFILGLVNPSLCQINSLRGRCLVLCVRKLQNLLFSHFCRLTAGFDDCPCPQSSQKLCSVLLQHACIDKLNSPPSHWLLVAASQSRS